MTPYRPLPVLPERKPMAVCAWCRHSRDATYSSAKCLTPARHNRVTGERLGDACGVKNPSGSCPDYQPTLFTRLAWWRRAWL